MSYYQKIHEQTLKRGCGEKGTLLHCWWECKLVQPLWSTLWRFRRGSHEEIPLVQGKEQQLCFAGAAMKRYPTSKVKEIQVRHQVKHQGRCFKGSSEGRHTETIITKKLANLITQTTALSNSVKLSHAVLGHPR